jgi:hypothetical protein
MARRAMHLHACALPHFTPFLRPLRRRLGNLGDAGGVRECSRGDFPPRARVPGHHFFMPHLS